MDYFAWMALVSGLLFLLGWIPAIMEFFSHKYHKALGSLFVTSFFAIFVLYYALNGLNPEVHNAFGTSLGDAVASFAVQFDKDALKFAVDSLSYYVILIDIESVANLLLTSMAVISLLVHALRGNFKCWVRMFFRFFEGKDARKRYLVFTDLPYPEVKDFLAQLEADEYPVSVVLDRGSQYVQPGTELTSLLKNGRHDIIIEDLSPAFLIRFAHFGFKVAAFSLYAEDRRNQAFAEMAAKLYEGEEGFLAQSRAKKAKEKIDCYVSFQHYSFEDRYGYEKRSEGHIHLYSEYHWVAEQFVYENPISDFVLAKGIKPIDVENPGNPDALFAKSPAIVEKELPSFGISYFGFGGINSELFEAMATAYQLPGEDGHLLFRVLDSNPEEAKRAFSGLIGLSDPINFLSGRFDSFLSKAHPFHPVIMAADLKDPGERDPRLIDIIASAKAKGRQEMIFISLGNAEDSLSVAYETQDFIIRYLSANAMGDIRIPIYVYIPSNSAHRDYRREKEGDNEKTLKDLLNHAIFELADTKGERKAFYEKAKAPIVIYGRNGRFAAEKECSLLEKWGQKMDEMWTENLSLGVKDDVPFIQNNVEKRKPVSKAEYFRNTSTNNRNSSYAATLTLPTKLAFFGLKLVADEPRHSEYPSSRTLAKALEGLFVLPPFASPTLSELQKQLFEEKPTDPAHPEKGNTLSKSPVEAFADLAQKFFYSRLSNPMINAAGMEHNRWVSYVLFQGTVPMSYAAFDSLNSLTSIGDAARHLKAKTGDGKIHLCLTSNAGLREIQTKGIALHRVWCNDAKSYLEGVLSDFVLTSWNDYFLWAHISVLLEDSGYHLEKL